MGITGSIFKYNLDWMCPSDLKDMPAIVGGEYQDFTYGDCQPEMDKVNRILWRLC